MSLFSKFSAKFSVRTDEEGLGTVVPKQVFMIDKYPVSYAEVLLSKSNFE